MTVCASWPWNVCTLPTRLFSQSSGYTPNVVKRCDFQSCECSPPLDAKVLSQRRRGTSSFDEDRCLLQVAQEERVEQQRFGRRLRLDVVKDA